MSLLRAVIDHFVVPSGAPRPARGDFVSPDEGPDRACAEPSPRTPPGAALLSAAADAQPLGAAVGLALASRRRSPVAVVCIWTADLAAAAPRWRAPAAPAARRLAAAMGMRGLRVRATGRVVFVPLGSAPADACEQARRALAASGDAPTVLALGGPRVASLDRLLFEQDLVVVASATGADPALARLAALDLAVRRGEVCVCQVELSPATRAFAAAGLLVPGSIRRTIDGPIRALA